MSRRNKKVKQPVDVQVANLEKRLKEQKKLYELAQAMLMNEIIRFIDAKEYVHLRQFCDTYRR